MCKARMPEANVAEQRMWQSHQCPKDECGRTTNVAKPRMSEGRMLQSNECGKATNVRRTNVAEQRMWQSHESPKDECCRATNVAKPRKSEGRMLQSNECPKDECRRRMFSTNACGECLRLVKQRSSNSAVPKTKFLSTPDSSGKPLSEARSLERIAGKGSKKDVKKKGANRCLLLHSNLNLTCFEETLSKRSLLFHL